MSVEKHNGFKTLLNYPDFIKVWLGRLISRLGDSIDSIAFMWMIYELTGSSILMGTIMAVNFIPNVIFGLFSGVFVDRWKKKPVMISGDLGRGICVTLIALLYVTGKIEPWHLFIITFINSTFETFAVAARSAVIPRLVIDEKDYLTANSLFKASSSLAEFVGLGLAGFIIATFGIGIAIFMDAATFFLCALFIIRAKIPTIEKEITKVKLTRKAFNFDFKEGLNTAFKTPVIRISILLGISLNFFISPFNILAPLYVNNIFQEGAKAYSLLALTITGGIFIASILIGQFAKKLGFRKLIVTGVLLMAIGFFGFYLAPVLIFAMIASFFIGIGAACLSSSISSLVMKVADNEVMGRVSSVMNSLMMAAMPASTSVAGIVANYYSTRKIFLTIAIAILVIGLFVITNQGLKKIENKQRTKTLSQ
ncbi:MAG: MFS transporter [Halanaerobiales bacterium]